MDIRAVPAGQGLAWFKQAIDLGGRNPRAVFGAALLLIAALYAAALLMALVLAAVVGVGGQGKDEARTLQVAMAVALPLTLLIMLLVPILLGGLMHVVRETEAGRPACATDVFVALRSPAGRRLGLLGLVQVVLALLGVLLMVAIAGSDYWRDYLQAMQAVMQGATPAAPQPQNAGLLFLVQLVFNYFSYALMLFSIPLMLFGGHGVGEALRGALHAALRNAGANLIAGGLFLGALLVGALVAALVTALLAMIGGVLHQAIGSLLALLAMFGFAAVVLVLLAGITYLAWRDTFGDAVSPPPLPQVHGFEA